MNIERFTNRREAGKLLAKRLASYANSSNVMVLGLPRGGVPVAFEVALALHAPLDVLVVRKLGSPGNSELAMGAIAEGGVRVLNDDVVRSLGINNGVIEAITRQETQEMNRRVQAYRGSHAPLDIRGKTVILVDDGVATGSTMRAAICAIRTHHPARIIAAVPTIARSTYREMLPEVDDMVALLTPEPFFGVGEWYTDFSQTSDAEVSALMHRARHEDLLK